MCGYVYVMTEAYPMLFVICVITDWQIIVGELIIIRYNAKTFCTVVESRRRTQLHFLISETTQAAWHIMIDTVSNSSIR